MNAVDSGRGLVVEVAECRPVDLEADVIVIGSAVGLLTTAALVRRPLASQP